MKEGATVDHRAVDWSTVLRTQVSLEQELRYTYPGPVYDLRQCLMVIPADEHGGQRLVEHELAASIQDARRLDEIDAFGNKRILLHIPEITRSVVFTIRLVVEQMVGHEGPVSAEDPAHFLTPTGLTAPSAALETAARTLSAGGAAGATLADGIMAWVHGAMRYSHDVTCIHTTAAEALAFGRGVCQDYAHIMLALCRLCGLPARYVSGHMLGEGGTHAWVEVLVETATGSGTYVAMAYDPTHNRRTGPTYLTVAVGRDYRDVAPTSGTYRAPYTGTLLASKRAMITRLDQKDGMAA